MKGVRVEDYFPDLELFINSAKGANSFTDQDIYRLKKNVQNLKLSILNDEFETK